MKVIDSISGKNFQAISSAVPEFLKHGMKLEGYRIVVMEVDGRRIVLFEDSDKPTGQRGGSPTTLSFEVELGVDGVTVVRSNFVR